MNTSFTAWLRTKKEENNRIGDLARDMLRDISWPQEARNKLVYRRHLERMGACDAALDAFNAAWKYYQQEKGYSS